MVYIFCHDYCWKLTSKPLAVQAQARGASRRPVQTLNDKLKFCNASTAENSQQLQKSVEEDGYFQLCKYVALLIV